MKRILITLRLLFFCLAGCAQMQPGGPVMPQPRDLADSTVRIDALVGPDRTWSGTAWIPLMTEDVPDRSWLVTAAHVCEDESIPAEALRFEVVDRWGVHYEAEMVRTDSMAADLCLLRTLKPLPGSPLALAQHLPEYGEPLVMVSAPLGVWACDTGATLSPCGNAPISRGWYAGGYLASLPAMGGSSGAAILSADGVVGVMVEGYRQYPDLAFFEPVDHIRTFLYQ